MGSVHVFNRRFPALTASFLSSMSFVFFCIAGTTCSFLDVNANRGRFIENTNESFQEGVTSASFGILCDSEFFSSDGDPMWKTSKAFMYLSLVAGSLTTALAWILTYGIPPTGRTWKTLSIMSAMTVVLTIPIFLILESEPCTIDVMRQQCSISFGSYILIAGALSSITVTLLTQSVDPPRWGIELDAWKVGKRHSEGSNERLSISRDMVASDEYDDVEDPAPADAPVAAPVGVLELVKCWNERRKWNRSSDLKPVETFGTSGVDEEEVNVPFAGAGSYYAGSNDSRLVLKVTPDGKLLGDDRKSLASFGDLDDYVKMAEEERELSSAISTTSLDDFLDNASVPEGFQREGDVHVVVPIDAVDNNDGPEKFPDEPQFYSEIKPPSSADYDRSLLDSQDKESSDEEDDYGPTNKLSLGIRSLTNRVRDSSRRVKTLGRPYVMMDDDDEESTGAYSIPSARDGTKVDESNGKTPASGSDHLHHQKLLYDWNALHAAANAGILLSQDLGSDSSDEDEPESPYFSPNDTTGDGETSSSSMGHIPDGEDDDSTYSNSSLSDVSDDKEVDRGLVGAGVVPMSRNPRKDKAKQSRKSRRKESSVHSVSSYTSLLDLTIDEETDMELKEFESSVDDSLDNFLSGGYKSAPETLGGGDRGMSPYEFIQSETLPANAERGYIVPRTKVLDSSLALDSSWTSDDLQLASVAQAASVTPEKVEYRSEELSRETRNIAGCIPSADREGRNPHSRRCRSVSIPRRKKKSSIHPLVTPPKSSLFPNSSFEDTPSETTTSWREERLYKGGIHNPAVHIVSDDENSDECNMSERSVKSSISLRARKARIRRLQQELENSTTNRKRSRTLDPPKKRRETKESVRDLPPRPNYRYDLPERNNPTLNRLLFGSDYGPDEASL